MNYPGYLPFKRQWIANSPLDSKAIGSILPTRQSHQLAIHYPVHVTVPDEDLLLIYVA